MSWTALRVWPTAGAEEAVAAALFAHGSQGLQEDGATLLTQFPTADDTERARLAVLAADPAARTESFVVPETDWSREWRHGIAAHALGSLVVTPPWLADQFDPERRVVIEPGMAFGTGEHPTTRGVVRLMQQALRPGDVVADLGAGSAVLAICAARLGAARVAAVELDPEAIENAEENVRLNGVADRVHVIEGDAAQLLPLVAPVRLVLANIISSVLLELLPQVEAALTPDGQAILSGILREERDTMLDAVRARGWQVEAEDAEELWWSVLLRRP